MNANNTNTDPKNNDNFDTKLVYPELSFEILGILFKVQNELGNGYQEKHYQKAIEIELTNKKIKYKKEIPVKITYGNENIGRYFLDFLIEDKIILETKAAKQFRIADFKQVASYLRSTGLKLGILANFKTERLTYKRILNSKSD